MTSSKPVKQIAQECQRFKAYASAQEYSKGTIAAYCVQVRLFLEWKGTQVENSTSDDILTYLEIQMSDRSKSYKSCRAGLRLYYKMLTGGSLRGPPEKLICPEVSHLLNRFFKYLVNIKYLKEETASSEMNHVQRFLEFILEEKPSCHLQDLEAKDIRDYVRARLSKQRDSSKGRHITSLRNFFRCQVFYGEAVHPSILKLPLSPAVWSHATVPTTIDLDVFNHLHEIPDTNTAIGKRNRCLILCFTELALRCNEVAKLSIDDFNWHDQSVVVRGSKGYERLLPVSETLFASLTDYLMYARPQTESRILFVRFARMCGEPMGNCQIRSVVRLNGAKAGLRDCESGTHILRRTAATKLFNSGNSLKLTADYLGHASLDSTKHYAKADVANLLSVAAPWLGGDSNARQ